MLLCCNTKIVFIERVSLYCMLLVFLKYNEQRVLYDSISLPAELLRRCFKSSTMLRYTSFSHQSPNDCDVITSLISKLSANIFAKHKNFFFKAFDQVAQLSSMPGFKKKREIILMYYLVKVLRSKRSFIVAIASHRCCQHQVVIHSSTYSKLSGYMPYQTPHFKVQPQVLLDWRALGNILGLTLKLLTKVIHNCQSSRMRLRYSMDRSSESCFCSSPLYFPHQGPTYGGLFEKNLYYTDLMPPSNWLHVELMKIPDVDRAYRERGIHYEIIPRRYSISGVLDAFIFVLRNYSIGFGLWSVTFQIYFQMHHASMSYNAYLDSKKNAVRLAVVGYDILFDPLLSATLQCRGYYVFAAQERMMSSCLGDYNFMIFNEYHVQSNPAKIKYESLSTCSIDSIVVSGSYRTDYISRVNHRDSMREFKRSNRLIVCFDYHTPADHASLFDTELNVMNNRLFYKDIIALSRANPGLNFIIKSKDIFWTHMTEYSDLLVEIDGCKNLSINFSTANNRTYKLLSECDMAIGKITSALDEARMANIPIIIHDYGVNYQSCYAPALANSFYTPDLFVHSFSELSDRFARIIHNDWKPLVSHAIKQMSLSVRDRINKRIDILLKSSSIFSISNREIANEVL